MMNVQAEYSCQRQLQHLVPLIVTTGTLCLPVYDVIIYPITNRCIPSTLQRSGVAQTLTVCTSFTLLVASIVWYTSTSPEQCVLTSSGNFTPLSVDYKWIVLPISLADAFFLFFFLTAMLEFVCAQAPYNLRGLLVGMLPCTVVLSGILGVIVWFIWTSAYKHAGSSGSMCGIWFYLFTTITANDWLRDIVCCSQVVQEERER